MARTLDIGAGTSGLEGGIRLCLMRSVVKRHPMQHVVDQPETAVDSPPIGRVDLSAMASNTG